MDGISRYFAVALGRYGITVNTVSPGFSDASTVVGLTPQEWQAAMMEWVQSGWTPMRRQSTPADIADVCALLCSDEAWFVTGPGNYRRWWEFIDECTFSFGASSPNLGVQAILLISLIPSFNRRRKRFRNVVPSAYPTRAATSSTLALPVFSRCTARSTRRLWK